MNLQFHLLTKDSKYFTEICKYTFEEWYQEFTECEKIYDVSKCEQHFKNILDTYETSFILYVIDDTSLDLIGFIMMCEIDFPLKPQYEPWICNLYVRPQYRNQGYARQLLGKCVSIANERDSRAKYLWTHDLQLKSLYESFGFVHIETLIHQMKPAYILQS